MKEIKAYIKPQIGYRIIAVLKLAGAKGIKIRDVSVLDDIKNSNTPIEYSKKYCGGKKIEFICEDEDANKFIEIIVKSVQEIKREAEEYF